MGPPLSGELAQHFRRECDGYLDDARSYDYFAELDEKLAVLQQSGREG